MPNLEKQIPLRDARFTIGLTILVAHFLSGLAMVSFGVYFKQGAEEIAGNLLVLAPLGATYAVPFVKYISTNPTNLKSEVGRTIEKRFFSVQLGTVLIFSLAIVLIPVYSFTVGSIDATNISVGAVETFFGAFLSTIFGNLFPDEVLRKQPSN